MKIKKTLLTIVILSNLSLFSQNEVVIQSCANYDKNISYNTGEVYVIFEESFTKATEVSKMIDENIIFENEIVIYPNPVIDILNIIPTNSYPLIRIFIFSLDGKIILNQYLVQNQVSLLNLPQGTYILKTDIPSSKSFKILKL